MPEIINPPNEMKNMDALESIAYAYLRYNRNCFFVQTNIAIDPANSGEGEVDLIGLQLPLKPNTKGKIFIVEATMQKNPYVGGDKMVKTLQGKYSRALAHIKSELKYFLDDTDQHRPFAIQKEFWAPKITKNENDLIINSGQALTGLTIVHGAELYRRMSELEKMFEKDINFGSLDIGAQFFMIRGSVRRLMNVRNKTKKPVNSNSPSPKPKS